MTEPSSTALSASDFCCAVKRMTVLNTGVNFLIAEKICPSSSVDIKITALDASDVVFQIEDSPELLGPFSIVDWGEPLNCDFSGSELEVLKTCCT